MVFLHSAAEAHDHWFVTERWSLAGIAGDRGHRTRPCSAAAGASIDDIAHFDLYSCFPSAVQIGRDALGIGRDDRRSLTVTGGLGFAGGPVNNYPTHGDRDDGRRPACAPRRHRAHDRDRLVPHEARGRGVVGASARAAVPPDRRASHGRRAAPARVAAGLVETEATIEATSVAFERDGNPSVGIITALADDGRRVLANAHDGDMLRDMIGEAWEGRAREDHERRVDEHGGGLDERTARCNRRAA